MRYDDTVNTGTDWMKEKGWPVIPADLWVFLTQADRERIIAHVTEGSFPALEEITPMKRKAEFARGTLADKDAAFEARARIASQVYALRLSMQDQHPEARSNIELRRQGMLEALCIALEENPNKVVLPDRAEEFSETEGAAFYQACEVRRLFED